MGEWIKIVIVSLGSGILLYLGKDKYLFDTLLNAGYLGDSFDVGLTQTLCFMSGTLLSVIILPVQMIFLKRKMAKVQSHYYNLLTYNKNNLFSVVKEQLGMQNRTFNLRIFVPQSHFLKTWNRIINNKHVLHLKNVQGISDAFLFDSLSFVVKGNTFEGMVGKSFKDKTLYIDFNMDNNQYHLTKEQELLVGSIKFCSTIPIFNKKQNHVRAILSVDSEQNITFTNEQKEVWVRHMKLLAAFVDKHV